jgi:CheY-like chemotaxis protein
LILIATEKENEKIKILLAEDSLVNQRLVLVLLNKKGFNVKIVSNGREAVETNGSETFDLILMDIQMPEMDGFEATGIIRDKEKLNGKHIPIIALTAHAMKEDMEKCLKAGMDDYLSKPIGSNELYAKIYRYTNSKVHFETIDKANIANMTNLLKSLDGNEEILKELVAYFIVDYPNQLSEILDAIKTNDNDRLNKAAHKLKGTVSNFEIKTVYELALQLENMSKESITDSAYEIFSKIEQELEKFKKLFTI